MRAWMRNVARAEARSLGAAAAVTVVLWWLCTRYAWVAWPLIAATFYGVFCHPRFRRALQVTSRRRPNLPPAVGPAVHIADRLMRVVVRAAAGGGRRGSAAVRRRAGMLRAERAKRRLTGDGWDGICREAGWCKADDGGERRAPSLLGVDVIGPDAVRVTWRPWNGVQPKDYQQHAAVIMRSIDAQTVRARADLTRTGVAVAHIGLRVLPTMVRCSRVPRPAGVGSDAAFWLGPFAGGGDAVWMPAKRPHLLIIGSTDKGKGGAARLVIAQAAIAHRHRAWDVDFVNTKRSGEAGYLRGLPWAHVHSGAREILEALQRMDHERDQLQGVLEAEGVDKWSDLPPRLLTVHGFRRRLVVVDELAALNIDDSADTDRIGKLLARLVMQMRSVGWHMVGMTQRPDAKALGPFGGMFRSQLRGAVLIVGSADGAAARMVSDEPAAVQSMLGMLGGVQGRWNRRASRATAGTRVGRWTPASR